MSDVAKDVKFYLKVMINKQKTKVLFAEADSDFVDVLLSFLTLPLGTIVRILEKHYGDEAPVIGSLTTLYKGLSNLGICNFLTEGAKQMLLNPISSFEHECRQLKLNIDDTLPTKYFSCKYSCYKNSSIGMYSDTAKCACGKTLNREISIKNAPQNDEDDDGVFSLKSTSFIIDDYMRIVPNVSGSVMQTLSNLEITDTLGAELRTVTFGFNEIMDLLKGLFLSVAPLTNIILEERKVDRSVKQKVESGILLHKLEKEANSDSPKKMILKIMVQKSTNKLIFAQAEEDFVDFLFTFLAIPLGGVESLLDNNSCLKNVDNFYRNLANINGDKYLKTKDTKTMLLKPKLHYGYLSKAHILPLQERLPSLYLSFQDNIGYLSPPDQAKVHAPLVSSYITPNGKGNYVKGSRMYMVTDDLNVTPLCMSTTLSILNSLEIPLSDVEEVEMHIGLEEALSVLKASLTSTRAITSLINLSSLKKCLKPEK